MSSLAHRLRLPAGRLHFAGTELAECWAGFINGAVESGERAAQDVLSAMLASAAVGDEDGQKEGGGSGSGFAAPLDGVDRGAPTRPLFRPEPRRRLTWNSLRLPVAGVVGSFLALSLTVRVAFQRS
jgi:hypothetical protein